MTVVKDKELVCSFRELFVIETNRSIALIANVTILSNLAIVTIVQQNDDCVVVCFTFGGSGVKAIRIHLTSDVVVLVNWVFKSVLIILFGEDPIPSILSVVFVVEGNSYVVVVLKDPIVWQPEHSIIGVH